MLKIHCDKASVYIFFSFTIETLAFSLTSDMTGEAMIVFIGDVCSPLAAITVGGWLP